jgi:hypothetical protein
VTISELNSAVSLLEKTLKWRRSVPAQWRRVSFHCSKRMGCTETKSFAFSDLRSQSRTCRAMTR